MSMGNVFGLIQLFFTIVIGLYFYNLLKTQQGNRVAIDRESHKEMEELRKMRAISLTEPLSEKTRPVSFTEIIGQEEGIKALRAALCGPNPQHVLIYGPPGIGKTAAARLVLEEAKRNKLSPFQKEAKFVEVDATTVRFDERGIADPLIGTVHDPIYQGAGPLGIAGIPQPKPGAVTKAHGGILFIDEIGELHPIQINKLLKVLEDRKVFLESAYYNSEDTNMPKHIHDIFQNGLPADFRLVGATTRQPEELPPAVRSRCLEIFFRSLSAEEIGIIAQNAAARINFELTLAALAVVKKFAKNGREAVNMIQIAAGLAQCKGSSILEGKDMEWVAESSRLSPRMEKKVGTQSQVGFAYGLAVFGPQLGMVIEIEAAVTAAFPGQGKVNVTGTIDEEEVGGKGRTLKRKSSAKSSVENVLTVLERKYGFKISNYNIHLNFPGGIPVDGPSAGVGIAVAVYSALTETPVACDMALTGELSIRGLVCPVGGVTAKIHAAREAGAKKVIIPFQNWQEAYQEEKDIEIIPVNTLEEVLDASLVRPFDKSKSHFLQDKSKEQDSRLPVSPLVASHLSTGAFPEKG